jgi:hypothetical protein
MPICIHVWPETNKLEFIAWRIIAGNSTPNLGDLKRVKGLLTKVWGGYRTTPRVSRAPRVSNSREPLLSTCSSWNWRTRAEVAIRIQRELLDRSCLVGPWQLTRRRSKEKTCWSHALSDHLQVQTLKKVRHQGNYWGHAYRSVSQRINQDWDW